ncbi:hypothetical protein [Methylomonas koyamae]|uniref:hypothetical protein n=1 Tax=Methylomonas koyamae TaxID=702114 RepID=UPI000A51D9C2|nr:hypothetical protein [Methylomonas koyamae]
MDRLYYRLSEVAELPNQTENGVLQLSAVGNLPVYILTGGFLVVPRWIAEIDYMPLGERMLFQSRVMRKLGIKNNMARIADCCIREFVTGDSEISAFIDNKAFSYTAQNGENKCGLLGFDLFCHDQPVKLKDCELVFKPADIERLGTPTKPAETKRPTSQPPDDSEPWKVPDPRDSKLKLDYEWWTSARYFAREIASDNPRLLVMKEKLRGEVAKKLHEVGITGRGNSVMSAQSLKKPLSNFDYSKKARN